MRWQCGEWCMMGGAWTSDSLCRLLHQYNDINTLDLNLLDPAVRAFSGFHHAVGLYSVLQASQHNHCLYCHCMLFVCQIHNSRASTRVQSWGTKRRIGVWRGGVPPTPGTPRPQPLFSVGFGSILQWQILDFRAKQWIKGIIKCCHWARKTNIGLLYPKVRRIIILGHIPISGGFRLGPGGHRPPKSCPGPPPEFLIGSIIISLSHCCLPNDEGPGPQIFYPTTVTDSHWRPPNRDIGGVQ